MNNKNIPPGIYHMQVSLVFLLTVYPSTGKVSLGQKSWRASTVGQLIFMWAVNYSVNPGMKFWRKSLKKMIAFVSWLSSSFLISLELPLTLRILLSKYLILYLIFVFTICGVEWMVAPLQPVIVHFFDYPYEEDVVAIDALFKTFGKVKGIRLQKYISREEIFTGTCLIDLVIERTPSRLVSITAGVHMKAVF